jgi:toxin ParE1/3/4
MGWTLRLAAQAEGDFRMILLWTREHFGSSQAMIYASTLRLALEELLDGPEIPVLHVARQGRKGRHVVVFRTEQAGVIDVLRILHDSMDLKRHVPDGHDRAT